MTTFSPILRPADVGVESGSRSANAASWRWAAVAVVLIAAVHVWLISAGLWTNWPQYSDRSDRLATALAAGQTHLIIAADPALLALKDPYDPVANERFRKAPGVHDACLYDGKLYYYWGPTPALLLVPGKWLLGDRFYVADQQLCFVFGLGIVAVTGVTLLRLRTRHFPDSPAWLPAVGVLLAGLSAPIACIMTRPAVYEVAILGGQFFLLLGVCLAWMALDKSRLPTLFAAGVCLALAVGSRVSLAIAVTAVAGVVTATIAWRLRTSPRAAVRPLLSFGLPLVMAAGLICLYNAVRFGHPLQFGQKYQLAGANLLALPGLFGVDNLWPNLWSYFVRPIAGLPHFPFVIAVQGFEQFPAFIRLPHGYEIYEPITGLPWVMPILLVIPVALLASRSRVDQRNRARETPTDSRPWGRDRAPATLIVMLVLSAVLGFAPVLLMIGSSQRYLADLTPPLIFVAMLSIWRLTDVSRVGEHRSRRRLTLLVTLSLFTAVIGVLISFEGYGAHFRLKNPALFERITGQPADIERLTGVTDTSYATH